MVSHRARNWHGRDFKQSLGADSRLQPAVSKKPRASDLSQNTEFNQQSHELERQPHALEGMQAGQRLKFSLVKP